MSPATAIGPWTARRRRAEDLRERHPFADDLLTLYLALLPVQEEAWRLAGERPPHPADVSRWAGEKVLPAVVVTTETAGPPALRSAVRDARPHALAGWLSGAELSPVDRFVARAALAPVLEALGERAGEACAAGRNGGPGRHCPRCGGPPQLSWLAASGEALVSGPRSLLCARCGWSWTCSRSVCPACGEREEAKLSVLAERWNGPVTANGGGAGDAPVFPHLRVAGCSTCRRYLIEVDMARDARAVPEVDELVALPLDLYAAEQGLTKLTANLMGF